MNLTPEWAASAATRRRRSPFYTGFATALRVNRVKGAVALYQEQSPLFLDGL
jgi:hypothetical protein